MHNTLQINLENFLYTHISTIPQCSKHSSSPQGTFTNFSSLPCPCLYLTPGAFLNRCSGVWKPAFQLAPYSVVVFITLKYKAIAKTLLFSNYLYDITFVYVHTTVLKCLITMHTLDNVFSMLQDLDLKFLKLLFIIRKWLN